MKNTSIAFICLFIVATILNSCKSPSETKKDSPIAIMAYYVPEKDFRPEELPLHQLTHIIVSFTNIIDGEMKFRNDTNKEKLRALVAQREKHPHLKIMIACGGWGADGFSDMVHSIKNLRKFVQSVVDFNEEFKLDGLDIDWEYPAIPAAGTKARPTDKQSFTVLMRELRKALNTLDREQTLTFASAGWKPYYDNVELLEVMKYVDYMNIMTYDQIGSSSPYTGHHTPLGLITEADIKGTPAWDYMDQHREAIEKRGLTFDPRSTERIVNFCIDQGVSPRKIVIGSAFYSRAWNGVPPKNNGLYQNNSGKPIGTNTYKQIREEFEPDSTYKRYWDPIAQAPYLYNKSDSIFISYDDTVSVRKKTEYAINQKLGGMMFWQLGNDTKDPDNLLKAIYDASKNN